jgi:hypothetical protein
MAVPKHVTAPKKVSGAEAVPSNPDKFCCYYGEQPFFSSADETVCHSVADKRKAELIASGVDIRNDEHLVEVRPL